MNKYRVLKPYPKQITNSGRLVTLKKGKAVYLKTEGQVLRLVRMGFLKPIVEIPKKQLKQVKKPKTKEHPKEIESSESKSDQENEDKDKSKEKRKSKSEYLNKKK